MAIKRLEMVVSGRVQGVGFRFETEACAEGYAILGFVRNEPDGSVYIVAEGESKALKGFIHNLKHSRVGPNIYGVDERWSEAEGGLESFRIRFH